MQKIIFFIFSVFVLTLTGCTNMQENPTQTSKDNKNLIEKVEKIKKSSYPKIGQNEQAILPFKLSIKGENINIKKDLELSHVKGNKTKINFNFSSSLGEKYNFDIKYIPLPDNRSYPTNLDITLKDSNGEKLGYLFWAINGIEFLKQMGTFGMIVDINGKPVDIKFVFNENIKGNINVKDLTKERFVQDTLVSKFGFQMIRPVVIPLLKEGLLSSTYNLDNHPYAINYSIKNIENGLVEFQHNLYEKKSRDNHLLERIYFHADNLKTLREVMYAGKYFHPKDGTFKIVFYPTFGQLQPNKQIKNYYSELQTKNEDYGDFTKFKRNDLTEIEKQGLKDLLAERKESQKKFKKMLTESKENNTFEETFKIVQNKRAGCQARFELYLDKSKKDEFNQHCKKMGENLRESFK
jgi:hypothetical protein